MRFVLLAQFALMVACSPSTFRYATCPVELRREIAELHDTRTLLQQLGNGQQIVTRPWFWGAGYQPVGPEARCEFVSPTGQRGFHPVTCVLGALEHWNEWLRTGSDGDRRRFATYVEYIREHLQYDEQGRAWAPYEMDWDYDGFGSFPAPWYSGMAQGAIASMFVRARALGLPGVNEKLLTAVARTLAEPSDRNIVKKSQCEHWIEEYPAAVSVDGTARWSHVINGAMWGLVGFHESALALGRADWMEEVRLAVATMAAALPQYDTHLGPSYGLVSQSEAPIVLYFDAPMADSSATFRIERIRLGDGEGRRLTAEAGRICTADQGTGVASIVLRPLSEGISIGGVQVQSPAATAPIQLYPVTREVDGHAFFATPPKWDYAWGSATRSIDGVTSRSILADGRPAVVVVPDATVDRLLTIGWKDDGGATAMVEYRGSCRAVLGSLVGDSTGTWRSTEFELPGRSDTLRVEPYLGFQSARRSDGRAGWNIQLHRPSEVWGGGWIRLFPDSLGDVSESGTLDLEFEYSGRWIGPLFLRIWNGDGHILAAIQSIDSGRARVKIPGAFLHRHLGTYVKNALVYAGLQYFGDILGCQSCIARKDDWLTRQQFSYVHRSLLLWADKPASWTAATLEYCLQGRCEQSGSDRWRVVPPTGLRDGSLQIGPDPLIVHVPLPGPLPERTAVMTGGTLRLEHHDVARGDGVVYLFDVHPMRLVLTPLDVWRPSDVSEASTREYRLP